jgi:hydrogenase maturation protein HypF
MAGDSRVGFVEHRVVRVRGVVQGVGFRPFVHRLATSLGLDGSVCNDTDGVLVDVVGTADALAELERRLADDAPPMADVTSVVVQQCGTTTAPGGGFRIVGSHDGGAEVVTSLPPDVAVCDQCLTEMRDPADRRYRYPFVTCTQCGPRFTITTALPYDRPNTTMAGFPLCAACRAEYDDPADRRYHAQPLACPECGPHLALHDASGTVLERRDDALRATQRLIASGAIVAVKSLGGYHLVCDATDARAVATLRERKHRGAKPFAVMVVDPADADTVAMIDPAARAALVSPQRPIVLLRRRRLDSTTWADHVAPRAADVGVMLPSAPLHHLLLDGLLPDGPAPVVVCTSGNVTDEPIVTDDAEAFDRLSGLADAWLTHDRPIHHACDDSIVRVVRGQPTPIRRARGFTPLPVHLGAAAPDGVPPVLAMGGDLKGAMCAATGQQAWLSQHLGDHGELATYRAARRAGEHLLDLVRVMPEVVAIDAHPAYLSSRLGRELAAAWGARVVEVQHHHAHLAALLAEHGRKGPAIGFVFDGTGYGSDATVWGGEVLVGSAVSVRRAAHLRPVPLPGGDAAIEHPRRAALAHLWAAGVPWDERLPAVAATPATERQVLLRQFERDAATVPTSSMGRLFDAVASLCGVRHSVDYEAQAAIELEAVADGDADGAYAFAPATAGGSIDATPVVTAVAADLLAGVPTGAVSMRLHRAVIDLVAREAARLREGSGVQLVGLTGGVFQNVLLLDGCIDRLEADGFEVLWHHTVPTNDGGLALGQALVAAGSR